MKQLINRIHKKLLHGLIVGLCCVILHLPYLAGQTLANGIPGKGIVSLSIEGAMLQQVLQLIEKKSDYRFAYDVAVIGNVKKSVSLNIQDKPISFILAQLSAQTGLNYAVDGKTIAISKPATIEKSGNSKPFFISGKITDVNGAPLPGVTIVVQGTTQGVITDHDGNYTLSNIPENASLQFTFMGMQPQVVKVGTQTTVNIVMVEQAVSLDEVVAIGYGTAKKKDLTSSITTLNSKDFNKGSNINAIQLLQGKVPGINITKDGNPNGATSVMLRGPSTLRTGGAQEPLYVVDGVPGGAYSSLDDIVSIDVLRDASATAIYGSRAANGVIIITTKRGEENNSKITYNGYVGVETISNKIDMMSADEYRTFLSKNGLSLAPGDEDNANTNWLNEVTRIGISHNNNISIGGGNGKTTYFASATYKQVDGIIKTSGSKSFSMLANVQQKAINDRLKIGLTIVTGISNNDLLADDRALLFNMVSYLPTVNIKNADGTYKGNFTHPGAKNPVGLIEQNISKSSGKSIQGTGQVQFNVAKGFDFELDASYQTSQGNGKTYYGKQSTLALGYNGMAIRSTGESEKKLIEAFTSYSKIINRHDLKFLIGYSWQEDISGDGFQTSNTNFISDEISFNNLGLGSGYTGFIPNYGTGGIGTLRMISGYARMNYSFSNKYLLQATIRRDGSSGFGINNRWGTFPSASAGWRIVEEPFMKNQHIFDNLKLRAGYGVSGNSLGFDPLISKLRYSTSGKFYSNGSYISAITPTQNENPNLKWESTAMLNIGLDFAVLKGRLSGTVEWYDKITKDLIYGYPVPSTQYYIGSMTANVGEMENKGWEVSISAIPVKSRNFIWNTSFNISFNKNNINSLSNDKFLLDYIKTAGIGAHGQSGYTAQIIKEGYPIGQFYVWKYAGRNAEGVSQFYKADGTLTVNPTSDDHFYEGNAQPKATGGWFNSISYKNFSLDFLFRGVTGNKILNCTLADLNYPAEATHFNMPKMTMNEPINDDRAHYSSTRYIEKGDYLRLDNVTLAYTFKMQSPLIKNLRVYSTVNNVFVITGYKGLDPEVYMGGMTPGIDDSNFYPKTRTFLFGVNVDF